VKLTKEKLEKIIKEELEKMPPIEKARAIADGAALGVERALDPSGAAIPGDSFRVFKNEVWNIVYNLAKNYVAQDNTP
jgi:hypothetical protein